MGETRPYLVNQPAQLERHERLHEIMLAFLASRILERPPGDSIEKDGGAIILNDFSNWTGPATPGGLYVLEANTGYHRNTVIATPVVIKVIGSQRALVAEDSHYKGPKSATRI